MGQITRTTSKGQLVALAFGQVDAAASQTDVQMPAAELTANIDGYAVPWDGEVVGIGIALTTAITAGSGTIGVTIGGTEDADTTLALGVSSATEFYKRIPRGTAPFTGGSRIGVEITTAAGWLPITVDVSVIVYVLLQLEGV